MTTTRIAEKNANGWLRGASACIGLAFVALAFYFSYPGGATNGLFYDAVGVLCGLSILASIKGRQPRAKMGWYLIAAGLFLWIAGDFLWTIAEIQERVVGYPSPSDWLYLCGYVVIIIGVTRLMPRWGRDTASVLDTTIVVVAGAMLVWVFLMAPYAGDSSMNFLEKFVSLSYPVLDFALFAMIARGVLMAGKSDGSRNLFLGAACLILITDVVYGIQVLQGTYAVGGVLDAGWLLGYVAFALSALHPSTSHDSSASNETVVGKTGRLWVVGSALFLMPALLLTLNALSKPLHLVEIVAASVMLIALVLARLGTVMRALRTKVVEVERRRRELDVALDERELLTQELFHNANHDSLTGLANRSLFYDRAAQSLSIRGMTSALLFIDLDDFKLVNDELGHQAGDELLLQVADRLRQELRFGDSVGRLGGDEFAVLLQQVGPAKARVIADRIIESLRVPFELNGTMMGIGASIGGAIGGDGTDVDALVSAADAAMYAAKARGKNSCAFTGDKELSLHAQ